MKIKIRQATPVDATDIAKVHVLSWQDSFRDLIDAAYLEQLRVGESEDKWLRRLSEAADTVLVAEVDGQIVGYVHGRKQVEKASSFDAELCAIYILKDYQRQGIGRDLFAEMLKNIKDAGLQSMNVWVVAKNQPARDFFMSIGGKSTDNKDSLKIGEKDYALVEYCWEKL